MKKRLSTETKRLILFALYIASMVIVNTVGSKISSILGVRVSVGIIFMPILFVISDIITEVYGRKEAGRMVNISTGILVFMFLTILITIAMPENPTWGLQREFELIFGQSLRMTGASIVSFFVSQRLDVLTFTLFRRLTRSKYLFIRNNLSTIISQFFDTVIFMFLAFWGTSERYTAGFLFSLILPYWLFKVVFALLDTPFCYLGVSWMRKNGDLPIPDDNGDLKENEG